ncbi:uncharacterized protein LAJ45_01467 [Morchella importuna]|nr:uncharacterized protein LAJ45_01467 [Morchella importuna]KAH8154935.1 hypothetical protein LAJ45_01467 [Morchella importuna]
MGNAQIKLLFPGHDIPFTVPFHHSSELSDKINRILADLGPSTNLKKGEWLLADVAGAELLHNTCLARVKSDRTYLVVDIKEAGKVKVAGAATATGTEVATGEAVGKGVGPPPGYEG